MDHRDAVFPHPVEQLTREAKDRWAGDVQGRAQPERRKDVAKERIVAEAGEHGETIGAGQAEGLGVPLQKVGEGPVRPFDRLRRSA